MKNVYELTGSMNNIEVDTELVFPNVQTCVAIVAVSGGTLVGAHATVVDKSRLLQVAQQLNRRSPGTPDVYVVGPVRGYNLGPLTDIGRVYFHECEGFIDVHVSITSGTVQFGKRLTGSSDGFTPIPLSAFD